MARKKEGEAGFEAGIDPLDAMLDEQRKYFNSLKIDIFNAVDEEHNIVGIPLPSFALMYLLECNVMPLSKVIGLAGAPQSYKSGLGLEMQRWVINAGGSALTIDTEGKKYSPSLITSILGKSNAEKRHMITSVPTIEEAQTCMSAHINNYKTIENARKYPSIMTVDSMTGNDSQGASTKIMEDKGYAEQDFSRMALLWSKYLRPFSSSLVSLPTTCILINHLKVKVDPHARPGQAPGRTTPGGDAQMFHSAFYMYVFKTHACQRKTYLLEGERIQRLQEIRSLKLQLKKSSLGVDGRDILVDLIWYYDDNNEQVVYFDWEAATVGVLEEQQSMVDCANPSRKLSAIVDIQKETSSNATVYTSNVLGIKKVEAHELGKAIHANADLMKELQRFFHIKQHKIWTPGK